MGSNYHRVVDVTVLALVRALTNPGRRSPVSSRTAWCRAIGLLVHGAAGPTSKPEAGAAAHVTDGTAGYLPAASHQPTSGGTLGLSLPAEGSDDHPGEPGVGG